MHKYADVYFFVQHVHVQYLLWWISFTLTTSALCRSVPISLSLSVKLLSVVVLALFGAGECWLSLFCCWADENKQRWKPLQSLHLCQLFSLFDSLPRCPLFFFLIRDQINSTSGLKVQLSPTQTFVVLLSILKFETFEDLKIKTT